MGGNVGRFVRDCRSRLCNPLPRNFLLDENDAEKDVEDDHPEGEVVDAEISLFGVDHASEQGAYEEGHRHADADVPDGLADFVGAHGVGEEGEPDCPDYGGGNALEGSPEDEEGDGVAEAEEEGGACEGKEAEEEGEAAVGGFVGEVAADGGAGQEGGAIDGEEDGDPVLDWWGWVSLVGFAGRE